MGAWEEAVADLRQFNSLHQQAEKKPNDVATLQKVCKGINNLLKVYVWAKKCLDAPTFDNFQAASRVMSKAVRDKVSDVEQLRGAIETYKAAVQRAVDATAPERFTYHGFPVLNEERFSDELCRKTLAGVDFLKAMFKRRGVVNLLEHGCKRINLVLDAEGSAYFHAGTRELTLSVTDLAKERPGRFVDTFVGETVLHEFGHFIHRNFITGEAAAAWDDPWEGLGSMADPANRYNKDPKRDERLAPLEIPTDYGKVDKYEDFAETFMLFIAAPERLSRTATFRMQRALALSGLYGKPVMRLSSDDRIGMRVAARYAGRRS